MSTLTSKRATVEVELTKRTRTISTPTGPVEQTEAVYVVTSGKYRAELPACDRDECTRHHIGRLPCPKPGRHTEEPRHNRDYCHNWHDESVETFAKQVLATYEPARRTERATVLKDPNALGEPITFERRLDNGERETRTGVIWSTALVSSEVWVLPGDDPTGPVAVRLPTGQRARYHPNPEEIAGYPATWQRDTIRRCDNLRRAGEVYGVVDREDPRYSLTEVTWHADRDCPDAAGKKPHTDLAGNTRVVPAGVVVDLMLSQRINQSYLARCCTRCVYLAQPAEAVE